MSPNRSNTRRPAKPAGRTSDYSDEYLIWILEHAIKLMQTPTGIETGDALRMVRSALRRLQGRYSDRMHVNWMNATKSRTKVTKGDLIKFRSEFILKHSKDRGWKPAACKHHKIDRKTLDRIWE